MKREAFLKACLGLIQSCENGGEEHIGGRPAFGGTGDAVIVRKSGQYVESFFGIVELSGELGRKIDGGMVNEVEELFKTEREEWVDENFRGETGEGLRWGREGGVVKTWMGVGEGNGAWMERGMVVWREACEEGGWGREGERGLIRERETMRGRDSMVGGNVGIVVVKIGVV